MLCRPLRFNLALNFIGEIDRCHSTMKFGQMRKYLWESCPWWAMDHGAYAIFGLNYQNQSKILHGDVWHTDV